MDSVPDRATKVLPLAVAVLYVLGFLVVGIYLAGFGASTLELFKVQYFAAGFWCTTPILAFLLVCIPFRAVVSAIVRRIQMHSDWTQVGWWPLVVGVLAEFITDLWAVVFLISLWARYSTAKGFFKVNFAGTGIHSISPGALALMYLPIVMVSLCLIARQLVPETFPTLPKNYTAGLINVLCIALIGAWLGVFAKKFYPKIPFSLGGGEPRSVVFVLNDALNQTAGFLALDGKGPQTVPYKLLLENEVSFVVIPLVDGQKVIEFDRKSVAAVIVLGKLPKSVD